MQAKHLIVFALVGIALLIGFNVISGNQHERNRHVIASNTLVVDETDVVDDKATAPNTMSSTTSSTAITSQPLGQQPKAIIDNVTTDIAVAQQSEQQRLTQMSAVQ